MALGASALTAYACCQRRAKWTGWRGSIGRDKFTEHLEDGFYASGRLLVYLDFAQYLTTNDAIRLELIESITTIHKIFAASVKTVRSKNPIPANVPVAV